MIDRIGFTRPIILSILSIMSNFFFVLLRVASWKNSFGGLFLRRSRKRFHQAIQIFLSVKKRLHRDAFVFAVRARIVHVAEDAGRAVHRDTCFAQIQTVGRACAHRRNHGYAGIEFLRDAFDGAQHIRAQWRRRTWFRFTNRRDGNAIVVDDFDERLARLLGSFRRQDAAIHRRA